MASVKDIYVPEDISRVRRRFEALFAVDPVSNCWNWTGSTMMNGYGRFSWSHPRMTIPAHRASLLIYCGELPAGQDSCHRCDNRQCVNPDHLWAGSRSENMRDAITKGRTRAGERNHNAVLTAEQVISIRASQSTNVQLARQLGVSPDAIYNVRRRFNWRHLP